MKIIGVGNDIVSIDRIEILYKKHQDSFLKRVLTDREIINLQEVNADENRLINYLAKRWAAKEAVIKALDKAVSLLDIEITKADTGKPVLSVTKVGYDKFNYFLALSDETPYIIANVVVTN